MVASHSDIIDVIIPALNEEKPLPGVLAEIDRNLVRRIIVADNGSTDNTSGLARQFGAIVVAEPQRGYGSACLTALQYIAADKTQTLPDIVVFLDADHADDPTWMSALVKPVLDDLADLTIGVRTKKLRQRGSMTFVQTFGNRLATTLMAVFWGHRFADLGPFRAIRYTSLISLNMEDTNYGWTVEMQIKALRHGLRCMDIEVPYRRRQGKSKISGTLKGSVLAGYKILWTIFRYGLLRK